MNLLISAGLLVAGFFLLVKGADWFVDGAAGFAKKLGVPQLVIGLTIVAMGTSAPEAAVSITAAIRGNADITIGNIVGSNILNILIILGITALIRILRVEKTTIWYEIPFMIGVTLLLLGLGYTENEITRSEGIILWMFFIGYLFYLRKMSENGKEKQEDLEEKQEADYELKSGKICAFVLAGLLMIIGGSYMVVKGAEHIAYAVGISEKFIGLTIVAFGTSLPELVTSVMAARKGNADIAIGNIVGSNIFNILFIVGTTALIMPVTFQDGFLVDTIVAVAAGFLLLAGVAKTKTLKKPVGIVMLIAYVIYFIYLLQ